MTVRGVTLGIAAAVIVAACSGSGDPEAAPTTITERSTTTTTTVPERPASTTTTAFDPASVEGAVEAAYLRSWDVYAEAVYDLVLDEQALSEVYAGDHLQTKTAEIARRIENGEAALVEVEHDYTIDVIDAETAIVVDGYQNHQVLIDPETKEPVEPDPNEKVVDAFTLRLVEGAWKVTYLEGFE